MTAGAVYADGLGELEPVRQALAWYPRDLWLWQLAGQWRRIAQEEHFPGRAAEVGDDLGRRVLVARLARDVMRLCFLLERRYAPYSKWLGTAFACLDAMADRALAAFEVVGAIDQFVDSTDVLGFRPALCRQVGRVYDLVTGPPGQPQEEVGPGPQHRG